MSDVVLDRIAAWESAGLIDAATAERLRAAEVAAARSEEATPEPSRSSVISNFFGPAVSIVEAFSYLGGAFVLSAWGVLVTRLSNEAGQATREWVLVAGFAIPAVVFFVIAMFLHGRSQRLDRAAGVAFLLSVALIWSGVTLNVEIFTDGALPLVAGAGAALVAAAAYRWFHPSTLTEIGLLAAITGLVQALLQLVDELVFRPPDELGAVVSRGIPGVVAESAAWIICGVLIGLIALAESRGAGAGAARRATVARFWAGIVVVAGVSMALTRTECGPDACSRVLEPWVADAILLVVSAVLVERAFRRESGAFVLAATLGVIIALTDFNFSYFAEATGTEVALLVEGLLLIAIAIAAERISRRVGRSGSGTPGKPTAVETETKAPEPEPGANPVSG
jgi:hypothetical protein